MEIQTLSEKRARREEISRSQHYAQEMVQKMKQDKHEFTQRMKQDQKLLEEKAIKKRERQMKKLGHLEIELMQRLKDTG